MDAFRDALDMCSLSDIGHTGTNWTFKKKVAGGTYTWVWLDRCVANPAWSLAYPYAVVEHKTAASSDHVPILLRMMDVHACRRVLRRFKYEQCWERDEGLPAVAATGWSEHQGDSV